MAKTTVQVSGDLLVYENQPRNAALLARTSGLGLRQVRSLSQLRNSLLENRPFACAVEARPNELPTLLSILQEANRGHGLFVIAMPEFSMLNNRSQIEPYLFEAGVDAMFWSTLDLRRIRALFSRHQQKLAKAATPETTVQPMREWAWSRLPWERLGGPIDPQ